MQSVPDLIITEPRAVIANIREIVGHARAQFPKPEQRAQREDAIDRRIYRLVMAALFAEHGNIFISRTHMKYVAAIERAFANTGNKHKVNIAYCFHMEANYETNNRTEEVEPLIIELKRTKQPAAPQPERKRQRFVLEEILPYLANSQKH